MDSSESPLRFITCADVINATGLSRTSIYTIPDFPRPIKIGGRGAPPQGGSRWLEHEIQNWMRSRIADRDFMA